jgi:hypothetical protein
MLIKDRLFLYRNIVVVNIFNNAFILEKHTLFNVINNNNSV